MDAQKLELLTGALFQRKRDDHQEKFLNIALEMLTSEPIPYHDMFNLVCKQLHEKCPHLMWQMDFETISRIIVATTLADTSKAGDWFVRFPWIFDQSRSMYEPSQDVCAGVILGLFNAVDAINCYDDEASGVFQEILVKVITNRNRLLENGLPSTSCEDKARANDNKIRGKLSEAIKRFVSVQRGPCYQYKRREQIQRILSATHNRFREIIEVCPDYEFLSGQSCGYGPTPFGSFVADQITFAVFSELNAFDRISALGFLLEKKSEAGKAEKE